LQLFADDPLSLNMGLPNQDKDLGNEMITYNSSLFDLADDNNEAIADSAADLFPDSDLTADQPLVKLKNWLLLLYILTNIYFCFLKDSELQTPVASIAAPDFSGPPSKRKRQ
jgi:hypothetical protein